MVFSSRVFSSPLSSSIGFPSFTPFLSFLVPHFHIKNPFRHTLSYSIPLLLAMSSATASISTSASKPSLYSKSHIMPSSSSSPCSGVVIWMHGLGDSSEGFRAVFEQFQRLSPSVKVVLPNAPTRSITGNNGAKMPGWYDIYSFSGRDALGQHEDKKGIEESTKGITDVIDYEIKLLMENDKSSADEKSRIVSAAKKIVLGGFSQGGAMTLRTGLWYPNQLGGLFVASGYLLESEKYTKESMSDHAKTVPLSWYHGKKDTIVPAAYAELGIERLREVGIKDNFSVKFEDKLEHSMSNEELKILFTFINDKLGVKK